MESGYRLRGAGRAPASILMPALSSARIDALALGSGEPGGKSRAMATISSADWPPYTLDLLFLPTFAQFGRFAPREEQ